MSRTRSIILVASLLFALAAPTGFALSADLKSVETDIVVRTDGKADFYESLDWSASGGRCTVSTSRERRSTPVFNRDQCFADLPGNVRVPLSITDLGGGKYDVVLAGGRGFSGSAMYYLAYGGDLAGPGLISGASRTSSASSSDFDWAAVQWDEPLEHRTTRIELPIVVAGQTVTQDDLTKLGFRTEPYVNNENSIDSYGTKGTDGKYYLTLRFHQENVATQGSAAAAVLPEPGRRPDAERGPVARGDRRRRRAAPARRTRRRRPPTEHSRGPARRSGPPGHRGRDPHPGRCSSCWSSSSTG